MSLLPARMNALSGSYIRDTSVHSNVPSVSEDEASTH